MAYEERRFSYLLRVRICRPDAGQSESHVFIKIYKPKPLDGGVEKMRLRVEQDFQATRL